MKVTQKEYKRRRKLWTEALRSGKYSQCEAALRNSVGYCCLGVACEVYIAQGNKLRVEEQLNYMEGLVYYKYDGEKEMLPKVVMNWFGLRRNDGHYFINDVTTSRLVDDNDLRRTFEEIAEIIEAAPQGLFKEAT